MILQTPRLRLVPIAIEDVDLLHRIWTDPDVRRYLWDDVIIDRETAAAVVEQSINDWEKRGYGLWLIQENDDPVGFAGFRGEDPELLFGLLPGAWHRGIATEAGEAALRFLGRTVWAATDVPNEASMRVLERLGMAFDRREGNTVFYVWRRD